ncbi:MAG: hypothetical protein RL698_2179 [Pseudomonadota bacterium]
MRGRLHVWSVIAGLTLASSAGAAHAVPASTPTIGRYVVQNGPSTLPGVTSCASAAAQSQGLTAGWIFLEDPDATQSLVDTDDAPWIAPLPAGNGALEQVIPGTGGAAKAYWVLSALHGAALGGSNGGLLGALSNLGYSHNEHVAENPANAPAFYIFVDRIPGSGPTFDDVLVWVPASQSAPCIASPDDWKACNALSGTVIPLSNSIPTTLAAYVAANPGVTISSGSGDPVFGVVSSQIDAPDATLDLDAASDLVTMIATSSIFTDSSAGGSFSQLQTDFEKDCSAYGGDADGDCRCDSTSGGSGAGAFVLINGDSCPGDPAPTDVDGDGVCGYLDNCPTVANADQGDMDGDGIGDACDNCVDFANTDQADTTGNGVGDACEVPSLSVRQIKLTDRTKADGDAWTASGELDSTSTPNFLDSIDTGGLLVALRNVNFDNISIESFSAAECTPFTKTAGSIRCKNANGSRVTLSKRSATQFFKVSIRVAKADVSSPTTTPMSIIVVNPAGRTREDGTTDCKTTGSNTVVSVCKNLP